MELALFLSIISLFAIAILITDIIFKSKREPLSFPKELGLATVMGSLMAKKILK